MTMMNSSMAVNSSKFAEMDIIAEPMYYWRDNSTDDASIASEIEASIKAWAASRGVCSRSIPQTNNASDFSATNTINTATFSSGPAQSASATFSDPVGRSSSTAQEQYGIVELSASNSNLFNLARVTPYLDVASVNPVPTSTAPADSRKLLQCGGNGTGAENRCPAECPAREYSGIDPGDGSPYISLIRCVRP